MSTSAVIINGIIALSLHSTTLLVAPPALPQNLTGSVTVAGSAESKSTTPETAKADRRGPTQGAAAKEKTVTGTAGLEAEPPSKSNLVDSGDISPTAAGDDSPKPVRPPVVEPTKEPGAKAKKRAQGASPVASPEPQPRMAVPELVLPAYAGPTVAPPDPVAIAQFPTRFERSNRLALPSMTSDPITPMPALPPPATFTRDRDDHSGRRGPAPEQGRAPLRMSQHDPDVDPVPPPAPQSAQALYARN
jgi:hypothetical protein